MTRLRPLLTALAAALLAVTACDPGGDPGPNYSSVSPTPSASTSASPTASPSPTVPTTGPNVSPGELAPTEPVDATTSTAESAQSFETYYVRTIDWVYATSVPQILEPFFAEGCTNCTNLLNNLQGQLEGGRSFRGSRFTIQRLAEVTNDGRNGADFAVSVEVAISPLQILDSTGEVTESAPETSLTLTNWLRWDGSRWAIVDQGKA